MNNDNYYIFDKGYYIIFKNISKSLPLYGWFQNCLNCSIVTSRIQYYEYYNDSICIPCKLYLCKTCSQDSINLSNVIDTASAL